MTETNGKRQLQFLVLVAVTIIAAYLFGTNV